MFSKIALLFIAFFVCSHTLGADGLPEGENWFLQPLAWNALSQHNLQVSASYVMWEGHHPQWGGAAYYYDGTGVYALNCQNAALGGSSIAGATGAGILVFRAGTTRFLEVSGVYNDNPDVYGDAVVWEAGDHVFYSDPVMPQPLCLTCTAECFNNGKSPVISSDTIAWLSNDGQDDEVFILKNGEVQQLTHNTVNEVHLQISDDGQLAWMTWAPMFEQMFGYVHYYDGERIRQMTVGDVYSWLCAISETGVLYTAERHPNYFPEYTNVLLHHNGTEETLIAGADESVFFAGASIGGGSIAWIEADIFGVPNDMVFLKDQKVIRWPLDDYPLWESLMTGVHNNRLVWTPDSSSLYFGEYLGPGCANRPQMDATGDCRVDLADFIIFAGEWLSCGCDDPAACL